jgi:hypothetical protein
MLSSLRLCSALALVGSPLALACGGATVSAAPPDSGSADAASDVAPSRDSATPATMQPDTGSPTLRDAAPEPDASVPGPPLTSDLDGGGMKLSCAPSNGEPEVPTTPFPACTFVDSQACQSSAECGCGCSCQCGVCNCNAQSAFAGCTGNADCGPACYGLTCVGGQCVSASSGQSPWIGTWEGSLRWPSAATFGTCTTGASESMGTGTLTGPLKIVVVGDGNELSFLLESQQGSGEPLCTLPFVVSGNTATLVPGSACVTAGPSSICVPGPPSVAVQTFLGGTATLQGSTLTLSTNDVFVEPAVSGPECNAVPAGEDQVNVESLTATLERAADGG